MEGSRISGHSHAIPSIRSESFELDLSLESRRFAVRAEVPALEAYGVREGRDHDLWWDRPRGLCASVISDGVVGWLFGRHPGGDGQVKGLGRLGWSKNGRRGVSLAVRDRGFSRVSSRRLSEVSGELDSKDESKGEERRMQSEKAFLPGTQLHPNLAQMFASTNDATIRHIPLEAGDLHPDPFQLPLLDH